jgi:pimeloyl-ACP methyl ester carboxylesterase
LVLSLHDRYLNRQYQGDLSYALVPEDLFYNECSAEQKKELAKHVQSMSWKSFTSTVTYTAWRDIPTTYLHCENDRAIPIAIQEALISATGGAFKTERCDADHSPFQSKPELAARFIRRVAGEQIEEV